MAPLAPKSIWMLKSDADPLSAVQLVSSESSSGPSASSSLPQVTEPAERIPGWLVTPKKLIVVGPGVAVCGEQLSKYGSSAGLQEKVKPAGANKFSCTMVAPVKLMKSRLTHTSVPQVTSCAGFTVKLKVSDVRTWDPPPPLNLKTGSVPSAIAIEQVNPSSATKTRKRVIFTTDPRFNLADPQQSAKEVQFHHQLREPSPIASSCNQ